MGQDVDDGELVEDVRLEQLDAPADRLEVLEARRRWLPDDAEHLVALGEQELREQRAVLASDPDDQCALRRHPSGTLPRSSERSP